MRDMLADPQGWCKRKFRPMWKIALRRVAAFFLTALVGVSAWLAVDTQAREAFFGWAKEVCETFFVYHYEGPIVRLCQPDIHHHGFRKNIMRSFLIYLTVKALLYTRMKLSDIFSLVM